MALFVHGAAGAELIRVVGWNMSGSGVEDAASTASNVLRQTAGAFKAIEPEVILLQHVKNWQTCNRLVEGLKPADYRVVICSSFRERQSGLLSKDQVAILSRAPAYFSWYENWTPGSDANVPGGFAFAAVQFGKQRFGFYVAQFGSAGAVPLEACASQMLKHAGGVDNWADNRIQGTLVGASFETPGADFFNRKLVKMLADAGYEDVLAAMPEAQRNAFTLKTGSGPGISDFLFAQPGACSGNPRILAGVNFNQYPILCDLDLRPALLASATRPKPVEAPTVQALASDEAAARQISSPEQRPSLGQTANLGPVTQAMSAATSPQPMTAKAKLLPAKSDPTPGNSFAYLWISGTAACLVGALVLGAFLTRRAMMRRFAGALSLVNPAASPYVVVLPRSVTGGSEQPFSNAAEPHVQVESTGGQHTGSHAEQEFTVARPDPTPDMLRAGLLAQFGEWLKDRFVRKILADRADLMQTQEAAALRALAVHERLARVEQQVQQQNQSYQRRIADLSAELLTAREENRELISERIRQIKVEMEAARMRALAEARKSDEIG